MDYCVLIPVVWAEVLNTEVRFCVDFDDDLSLCDLGIARILARVVAQRTSWEYPILPDNATSYTGWTFIAHPGVMPRFLVEAVTNAEYKHTADYLALVNSQAPLANAEAMLEICGAARRIAESQTNVEPRPNPDVEPRPNPDFVGVYPWTPVAGTPGMLVRTETDLEIREGAAGFGLGVFGVNVHIDLTDDHQSPVVVLETDIDIWAEGYQSNAFWTGLFNAILSEILPDTITISEWKAEIYHTLIGIPLPITPDAIATMAILRCLSLSLSLNQRLELNQAKSEVMGLCLCHMIRRLEMSLPELALTWGIRVVRSAQALDINDITLHDLLNRVGFVDVDHQRRHNIAVHNGYGMRNDGFRTTRDHANGTVIDETIRDMMGFLDTTGRDATGTPTTNIAEFRTGAIMEATRGTQGIPNTVRAVNNPTPAETTMTWLETAADMTWFEAAAEIMGVPTNHVVNDMVNTVIQNIRDETYDDDVIGAQVRAETQDPGEANGPGEANDPVEIQDRIGITTGVDAVASVLGRMFEARDDDVIGYATVRTRPWQVALARTLFPGKTAIFTDYAVNGGALDWGQFPNLNRQGLVVIAVRKQVGDFRYKPTVCFGQVMSTPRFYADGGYGNRLCYGDSVTGAMIGYGHGYMSESLVLADIPNDLMQAVAIVKRQWQGDDMAEVFDEVDAQFYPATQSGQAELVKIYAEHYGQRYNHILKNNVKSAESDLQDLVEACRHARIALAKAKTELEIASGVKAVNWQGLVSEFDKIQGAGIVKVVFTETDIVAFTDEVIVKDRGKRYRLGRFMIGFPYAITENRQIRIGNLVRTVAGMSISDAAHVFSDQKSICWGSCEGDINTAIARHDIVDIVYVCRNFLEVANVHDPAGKYLLDFPEVVDDVLPDISYTPPRLATLVHIQTKGQSMAR